MESSCVSVWQAFPASAWDFGRIPAPPVYLGSPFITLPIITLRAGYVQVVDSVANRFLCTTCVPPVHEQPILREGTTEEAMHTFVTLGGLDDAVILLLEVCMPIIQTLALFHF